MSWTEEKVSQLRELWDQGLPTSQIGKILDFSKNAVVGKAHRIGLERRPSPIKRSIMKPDRKKARAPLMPNLSINLKSDKSFEQKDNSNEKASLTTKDKFIGNNIIANNKNSGCVISTSIDKYSYIKLKPITSIFDWSTVSDPPPPPPPAADIDA